MSVSRSTPQRGPAASGTVFVAVSVLLLATGWAANNFVGLIPAISDRQHLSAASLDAIFGIYAVGLLPGLLIGGRASDTIGRQVVTWAGSATLLLGTLTMLFSQHPDALLAGRFIVGAGVGFTMSACTAWASDMKGPAGAAAAGAVLMAGFAIGPFVAGLIASAGQPGIRISFAVAAVLLLAAMLFAMAAARRADVAAPTTTGGPAHASTTRQSAGRALSWALPLAPWVFASATLAFVTIPRHVHVGLAAPLAAGTAALIVNGTSGLIQTLARSRDWGPQTGTVGAVLAALGYAATAAAPATIPLALALPLLVVLGCASGLCLREGLIDLEAAAPQRIRGTLTGVFYTMTYIGFGLPLLLTEVGATPATATILAAMAVLALITAISRAARLRRDSQHRPAPTVRVVCAHMPANVRR
jgi:MFS family permease